MATNPISRLPPLSRDPGHCGGIAAAAVSPDGGLIATGGWDRTVLIRQAADGSVVRRVGPHDGIIYQLSFTPDARGLLVAPRGRECVLWDLDSGLPRHRLRQDATTFAAALSADGRIAVAGSADGKATAWDAFAGIRLWEATFGHAVFAVGFDASGERVAIGLTEGTLHVLNAADGRKLFALHGHTEGVNFAAFSRDGRWLLSGSDDGTGRIWDLDTRTHRHVLRHGDEVRTGGFMPNGRAFVIGSRDRTTVVRDVLTAEPIHVFRTHAAGVNAVGISPGGDALLTCSRDGWARWHGLVGECRRVAIAPHSVWITALASGPGGGFSLGTQMAGAGEPGQAADNAAMLVRADGRCAVLPLSTAATTVAPDDHGRVFVVDADGNGRWWLPDTGEVKEAEFDGCTTAIHLRGTGLWAVGGRAGHLHLAQASGGVRTVARMPAAVVAVAASRHGLFCGDERGGVWRWRPVGTVGRLYSHKGSVAGIQWLPEGRLVSAGEDGEVIVSSVDGTVLRRHHAGGIILAFAANTSVALVALADGRVLRWAVGGGAEPLELIGSGLPVVSLATIGNTFLAGTGGGQVLWLCPDRPGPRATATAFPARGQVFRGRAEGVRP